MINKRAGFTMVELLLYMSLLTGFILILTDIFTASLNVETTSQSNTGVQVDGQYILARLAYDAGQAQDITIPATLGATESQLSFTVNGQVRSYSLNSGVLAVSVGGTNYSLNSYGSAVTGFSVTRLGNPGGKPTAQIIFTLTGTAVPAQGPATQTFTTTVGIR